MSQARIALLPDRGLVAVTGEDSLKLLQGIITNDMDLLATRPAIYAGLLSPQGKVLFDFLVVRSPDGFFLDVADSRVGDLIKRLSMYRLRAKADIQDRSSEYKVWAIWPADGAGALNEDGTIRTAPEPLVRFKDPRNDHCWRWLVNRKDSGDMVRLTRAQAWELSSGNYEHFRIDLGIPEGGKDWDFGDAFPHEANLDLLGGISFDKGCYVGQEIVSRMQHRGTVRKRIARVTGTAALSAGRPEIRAGEVAIGKLGSVAGRQGLALLRLDRAIETIDKGGEITADGIALEIDPETIARHRTPAKGSDPWV